MNDIRKKERKLYAEAQLLNSFCKLDGLSLEKQQEVKKKKNEVKNKQLFYQRFLIANDKVRKEK